MLVSIRRARSPSGSADDRVTGDEVPRGPRLEEEAAYLALPHSVTPRVAQGHVNGIVTGGRDVAHRHARDGRPDPLVVAVPADLVLEPGRQGRPRRPGPGGQG